MNKPRPHDHFLIALIMLFAIVMLSSFHSNQSKQNDPGKLLKNLVLIEGNESIQSFYISKYEVSNWEYLIYLEWLRSVFVEYPEVLEAAIPDTSFTGDMLWNPHYFFYPVIGVSWEQANNFCMWLTDRINEYLLIHNEILLVDPAGQVSADNFNTEAFLAEQYIGLVHENYFDKSTGDRKVIGWTAGMILPACRLPLESEWEFAFGLNNKGSIKSGKKKEQDETYMSQNPLYLWFDNYTIPERVAFYNEVIINKDLGTFTADRNHPYSKVYDNDEKLALHNMSDNISEWVYDKYEKDKGINNSDLLSIYAANGQTVIEDIELLKDRQKDRSGRMPYITLFVDENGDPVSVRAASPYLKDVVNMDNEKAERLYRGGSFETERIDARAHGSQDSAFGTVGFRYVISAIDFSEH